MRIFGTKEVPTSRDKAKEVEDERKGGKFLRDMGKSAYLEADLSLDERINRNAHYRDRNANKD